MKPDFQVIYFQKQIRDRPEWEKSAEAIVSRFPKAEIIEVEAHGRIPALKDADPAGWLESKRSALVLGVKAGLRHIPNGRSADYIAASLSNGCLSSCQYCYVARQKGGSNPLTLFVNIEQIADSIERHQEKLGPKLEPNQCDPRDWTYDIGCNADLSLDALVCDHPGYMVERFAEMKYAKATFATKTVNHSYWTRFDPKGRTRIRYSLMPQAISRYVDVRTSPIHDRLTSTNLLVEHGYEVHFNFSPIIMYQGENWKNDWISLFREIDDVLSPSAKSQLACEAFFLTHSEQAHRVNLQWNPKGESFLWRPEIQTSKYSKPDVLVYDYSLKQKELRWFKDALEAHLPYCRLRYSF